ncbi:retrovirus-related pol polyprotein from transposon TNT 1-94 [Tanacetum coccineum]
MLIEDARTMLIYAKAPLFLWAEAVATACYTQNRSIIRLRHGKTPYELLHDKPPDLSFFHVFGALCYPTNDSENLGKLQPKADIGIFIGYAPTKKAFRIYNRRTRRIIETIHVDFDELTAMASEQSSSGPALHEMTPATISSGLVPNPPPSTPYVPPSRTDWDILFQPMFDELLTFSTSNSQTTSETQPPVIPNDVEENNHDIEVAHMGNDPYFGVPILEVPSDQSSSSDSIHTILHEQALFCYYDAFLTVVEPKTYKDALTQSCWIEAMQEELNEFERLEVWELVPRPDKPADVGLWIPDNPNHVYKLKKARYGFLKHSSTAWYDIFLSFLISQTSTKAQKDPTLFHPVELLAVHQKTQKSTATSSTEAEYYCFLVPDYCAQVLWMRSQLTDYGFGFNKIPIYCDNKSDIALCCNNVQYSRSKHIDIRFHFIKEHVENGVIELYLVDAEYQLADIFTKALCRERIEFLINKLGMRSFTPETLKQLADEVDE